MPAPHRRRRYRRGHVPAGGESPLLQHVARIVRTDLQILDHKPPMAFELRTVRYVGHRHLFGGMNRQFRCLGPLRAPPPRPIAVRRFLRCRSSRFQGIGLQLRLRRTALQPPKLVLQPLNLLLLLGNDMQQTRTRGVCSRSAISGSFGWKGGVSMASSIADGTIVGSVYLQLMSI